MCFVTASYTFYQLLHLVHLSFFNLIQYHYHYPLPPNRYRLTHQSFRFIHLFYNYLHTHPFLVYFYLDLLMSHLHYNLHFKLKLHLVNCFLPQKDFEFLHYLIFWNCLQAHSAYLSFLDGLKLKANVLKYHLFRKSLHLLVAKNNEMSMSHAGLLQLYLAILVSPNEILVYAHLYLLN